MIYSLTQDKEENTTKCSFRGTFECGICNCNPGFIGKSCECSVDDMSNDSACRAQDSLEVCSGRGLCSCGNCTCDVKENPKEVNFTSYLI